MARSCSRARPESSSRWARRARTGATSRRASWSSCTSADIDGAMRWLLLKDLRILRRSPLLVALLVLYPIVIAILIGFAISRGPDKPEVAFYNGLSSQDRSIKLGATDVDLNAQAGELFGAIDAVPVDSRAEAIQKVRDGDALGALIIPSDLTRKLQSGL